MTTGAMTVTEDTPARLRLDHAPWFMGVCLAFAALAFAAAGLSSLARGEGAGLLLGVAVCAICFAAFVERSQFWAETGSGAAVLRRRSLFGKKERRLDLAEIRGALVQSTRGARGKQSHRPAIALASGETLPLRSVYVSGGGTWDTAETVNAWLARAQQGNENGHA